MPFSAIFQRMRSRLPAPDGAAGTAAADAVLLRILAAGRAFAFTWDLGSDEVRRIGVGAAVLGAGDDLPMATDTGARFLERIHPADRPRYAAAIDALSPAQPAYAVEYRYCRSDGAAVWLEETGTAEHDAAGRLRRIDGIAANVSDRHEARAALQRFSLIAGGLRDVVLFIAPDGTIRDANRAAEATYGYKRTTLLGMSIHDLRAAETLPEIADEMHRAAQGGLLFETTHRRADGSLFPVEVSSTSAEIAGETMLCSVVRDVTGRKRAEAALRRLNETLEQRVAAEVEERRKAEATLLQIQKMEAIGQLTGGIAHDFNNLLAAVLGNIDLISRRSNDPDVVRLAANAARAAERGARLTGQLLAFSRREHLAPRPVDLNEVVLGMGDLLARTIGVGIRIEPHLDAALWPALVDPTQIELVILNLAINARDAMPGGGVLRIETANEAGAGGRDDDRVLLVVADEGVGMSEAVRARAFEPFFTTKQLGKGTGLGLSTVYGVVTHSGGTVEIESTPGAGTRVRVRLRRADAAPAAAAETGTPRAAAAVPGAVVLVVDDDADVREVVRTHLVEHGYRVREAASGAAALALLAGDARVDLLVADVAMPEMSGPELAERARRARPGLPLLYATGFADGEALRRIGSDAGDVARDVVVIRKPFRLAELTARVAEALRR